MTDIPILFSAPMVRALLEGRKTQTRRAEKALVIEPAPNGGWHVHNKGGGLFCPGEQDVRAFAADYSSFAAGDWLWVREAWKTDARFDDRKPRELPDNAPIYYLADEKQSLYSRQRLGRFMMKWMSRLSLQVTEVRVQRLQDISEEDARAEGCPIPEFRIVMARTDGGPDYRMPDSYRAAYANLWDEINGAGAWDRNPWITAITFKVHRQNIDAIERAS